MFKTLQIMADFLVVAFHTLLQLLSCQLKYSKLCLSYTLEVITTSQPKAHGIMVSRDDEENAKLLAATGTRY